MLELLMENQLMEYLRLNKMNKLWIFSTLLILSTTGWAFFTDKEMILPSKSNMDAETHDRVTEWTHNFEQELSPLIRTHGGELQLVIDWNSSRANAEARRQDDKYLVIIYSGLLNHPELDRNMLHLILCHEVGHHLGGQPTASRHGWSSAEGQADYYSTLECIKELPLDNRESLPQTFEKLAQFYAKVNVGSYPLPRLSLKDPTQVPRTYFGHPTPQCRLDTMLAGFNNEPRPVCWYKED
jgi:hypothetical protein